MVITRGDWRLHGDLLEWIATTFPGLTNAQFEAAYRLLISPGITEAVADQVEVLIAGCAPEQGHGEGVSGTGKRWALAGKANN